MTNRTGAGRPNAATFVTSWGETVEGAYKGKDGKLRPIGRARPAFSLTDEARAVHKFKRWWAEQGEQPKPKIPVILPSGDETFDAFFPNAPNSDHLTPAVEAPTENLSPVTSELEWILQQERKRLHDLILTDPRRAAIELDVEHLSWYPARPEKPQFTLAELHSFYLEHKRNKQGKPLAKKHKENSKRWWKEFLTVVGVRNYRELTLDQIRAYKTIVMTPFDKNKASASYVRNRFAKIKAVFNFGLQECEEHDKPQFRRILDLCLILRHPAEEINPRPIPTDAYTKLLAVAPPRERAILLIGLNCLMHSGEAATTLKKDCDLNAGSLSARRSKNRRPRVAKLWGRTVEAIREYQRLFPHHSEYLFVSRTGTPVNVRQQFMTLRKKAGLPKDVTFEGLRDAAYTIAEETDAHHAKFIAGHKTGMSDKYVLRQATNKKVVACCEAIDEHFFGKK